MKLEVPPAVTDIAGRVESAAETAGLAAIGAAVTVAPAVRERADNAVKRSGELIEGARELAFSSLRRVGNLTPPTPPEALAAPVRKAVSTVRQDIIGPVRDRIKIGSRLHRGEEVKNT